MIYALDADDPVQTCVRAREVAGELEGVDLVMWRHDDEAVISSRRGELRFTAGGELSDARGKRWSVEGNLGVLRAEIQDGRILSTEYPDGLDRVWSALHCPNAGDILLSAAPGYEFVDWGGSDHVGGGSHGSLHRTDSLGALLWCGLGPDSRAARDQWSLRDIATMIRSHFGLGSAPAAD